MWSSSGVKRHAVLGALLARGLVGCSSAPPPPSPLPVAPSASTAPAPVPLVHVQVLAINDLHGNLEPPQGHDGSVFVGGGAKAHVPAGGVAYLAAHVGMLRKENPNTVVVSAGDLTGASPLVSNLFHDEPVILAMNLMRLDFEGVGNHDFDRGSAELLRLQTGGPASSTADGGAPGAAPFPGARFQYLAANVLGSRGATVFPPYIIREFGGVKVAFLGMTLEGTPTVTTATAIAGLKFLNEAKTANALLPELRTRDVATTVILLHQGGFQGEGGTVDSCEGLTGEILPVLSALDPAFRVVVTGHTHQAYDCKIDGRIVTSAASYGRVITKIDLTLDPATKTLVSAEAKNVVVTRDVPPDPQVQALVEAYKEKALPVTGRVVGYLSGTFTRDPKTAHSPSCETPLGDLIADAELAATTGAHAVLAFMNPGGIRTDLTPDATGAASPVRYAAAFEVQPFGNRLVTVTLTGAEIVEVLSRQFGRDRPRVLSVSKGFTYRYVYDPKAHAVTIDPGSLRLAGAPVKPAEHYRVTVNSFLASGGDGFSILARAPEQTTGDVDIDALTAYLGKKSSAKTPLAVPTKLDRVVGNACE
jgi:5'-nucleotidase